MKLLALTFSGVAAFGPSSLPSSGSAWSRASVKAGARPSARQRVVTVFSSEGRDSEESDAATLLAAAKAARAEVSQLELEVAAERRAEEASSLDRFFARADANGDGVISVSELRSALERELVAGADSERAARRNAALLEDEQRVASVARTFDANGDGVLQRGELVPVDRFREELEVLFRAEQSEGRAALAVETRREDVERLTTEALELFERSSNATTVATRLVSVLAYALPALDALPVAAPVDPLVQAAQNADPLATAAAAAASQGDLVAPLLAFARDAAALYHYLPFSGLIVFFSLSSLASNANSPRLARFSARHAIILDFVAALLLPLAGAIGFTAEEIVPPFEAILLACAVAAFFGVEARFAPITGQIAAKFTDDYQESIKGFLTANVGRQAERERGDDEDESDKDDEKPKSDQKDESK